MYLDHAAFVTDDLDALCGFFTDVVGLEAGPRPPFPVEGRWFYLGGRPAIHLIRATQTATVAPGVPRIDHVALRIDERAEWEALLGRLASWRIAYRLGEVPLTNELQLFVPIAPGVTVEFVTTSHRAPA